MSFTRILLSNRVVKLYIRHSEIRPFVTNSVIGGGVFFVGDGLAQTIEGKRDVQRIVTATAWNGLFASPFFFYWFRYLDTRFGVTPASVMKKVILNSAIASPPVNIAYLLFSTLVEGLFQHVAVSDSLNLACSRIEHNLGAIISGSFVFWIPVNTMNFLFVPKQLRVLPSILGGVCWSVYLSHAGHADNTLVRT